MVYKESITILPSQQTSYTNFEHLECSVRVIDNTTTKLCVIYWLPGVTSSELSFRGFIDDFSTYLEHLVDTQGKILIVDDFNIHVDIVTSRSSQFANILEGNGLKQLVNKVLIISEITFLTLSLYTHRRSLIRESPKVLDPALCNDKNNVVKYNFTVHSIC